jgi:phosphoribosylglycinamide formyltransferase 1
MLKIGVLASGRGSNFQAIIDAVKASKIDAENAVCISDVADAYALTRAKENGIAAEFIDPKQGGDRTDYDKKIIEVLQRYDAGLVLLAGYMRLVSPVLVEAYKNKIMNIHPALLPSFPGLHVQRKAIEYGARFSGCTVHFVDTGMDTGPIIIQAVVPVLPGDTEDALSARILKQEHEIYPEAVRLFAEGKLEVDGRRVLIKNGPEIPDGFLVNPPVKE